MTPSSMCQIDMQPSLNFEIKSLTSDIHRAVHRNILCSKTNQMHQFLKFILFWNNTLRVSDGLSVHRQELKTVHTATGICLTYTCCCVHSLELLTMDGKTVRNTQSVIPK